LTQQEYEFYTTIPKGEKVFINDDSERSSLNRYCCDILAITFEKPKRVTYHLEYSTMEPGKKRNTFWLPSYKITHQKNFGLNVDGTGRKFSQRKTLPTKRLINEVTEDQIYHDKRKLFENMLIETGKKMREDQQENWGKCVKRSITI
jgi:hypothetical protein